MPEVQSDWKIEFFKPISQATFNWFCKKQFEGKIYLTKMYMCNVEVTHKKNLKTIFNLIWNILLLFAGWTKSN